MTRPVRGTTAAAQLAGQRIARRSFVIGAAAVASSLVARGPASAMAQTPNATPAVGESTSVTGISSSPAAALLRLVSARQATAAATSGALYYYADLAAQFDAFGIAQDGAFDNVDLGSVTAPLALASQAFQYALVPDFADTFGFQPLNIHRTLFPGSPPDSISIFQGGFDTGTVEAALKKSGFKAATFKEGVDYWSVNPDGELDLSSPVGQYGVGAFSNAVILDNEILVFGRTAAVIEEVIAQASGTATSMLDMPGVVETLNAFSPEMVSAIGISSHAFRTSYPTMTPEQLKDVQGHLAESDDTVGKMPKIQAGAFGVLAGAVMSSGGSDQGTPQATPAAGSGAVAQVRLFVGSASKAKQAAKVVAWRWTHLDSPLVDVPYTEVMTLDSAAVSDVVETVAAIDFGGSTASGNWSRLVLTGDLLPFS